MRAEQRELDRYPLKLTSRVCVVGEQHQEIMSLVTNDVCAGGAFFVTEQTLPLGTKVKIKMALLSETVTKQKKSLKLSGSVYRLHEKGMTVVFDKKYKLKSGKSA